MNLWEIYDKLDFLYGFSCRITYVRYLMSALLKYLRTIGVLTILLRFVLLGVPVVAAVFLPCGLILSGVVKLSEFLLIIPAFIVSGILVLGLAFQYCILQAAITGVVFWFSLNILTKQCPSPIQRVLLGIFIGASVNIPFGYLLLSKSSLMLDSTATDNLLPWVIAGSISSAICALSIEKSTYDFSFRNRNV